MAFPTSPSNGDTHTVGTNLFTYNSTTKQWNLSATGISDSDGFVAAYNRAATAGGIDAGGGSVIAGTATRATTVSSGVANASYFTWRVTTSGTNHDGDIFYSRDGFQTTGLTDANGDFVMPSGGADGFSTTPIMYIVVG